MKRVAILLVVAALLMAPSFGAANPNGVGDGTFDAQCGGACHGDADMNRTSTSTVTLDLPQDVYAGLLTSVTVTVAGVQTTPTGMLGIFLLSDVTGAEDTPEDDGWTVVSNSEGGAQNYVEVVVAPGVSEHTVEWTLRAPDVGEQLPPRSCKDARRQRRVLWRHRSTGRRRGATRTGQPPSPVR